MLVISFTSIVCSPSARLKSPKFNLSGSSYSKHHKFLKLLVNMKLNTMAIKNCSINILFMTTVKSFYTIKNATLIFVLQKINIFNSNRYTFRGGNSVELFLGGNSVELFLSAF